MGQRVPFQGFVGSAFRAQSPRFDIQELWNWYLEHADSQASKASQHLLPCPGFELFAKLPKSPVRGLFAQNDRTFAVGGDTLYELDRQGGVTERKPTVLGAESTPSITNSPLSPPIGPPGQAVLTHGGALGSTTYGYKVTAVNGYGETTPSKEALSTYGNATLSPTNWNILSWPAVVGATGYKIYRTTGGSAPQFIKQVAMTTLVYNDIGDTGVYGVPPTTDTSGQPTGATTYGYKIVATLGTAQTAASAEGVTVSGQTPLSSTSYNIITWAPVSNATGYKVYRTTGGAVTPPRLIATLSGNASVTFNDIGDDGFAETPNVANTTGSATLFDDGTPVQFASSGDAGNQLLIISGGTAYCYALDTNVFSPVLDGATFGGFIDSYFVVLDAGTSTLKVSESLDGFHWDGTQVYQRARAGDKWLAMSVTFNEIWLIGSQTGEVWVGTGDEVSRFTPYTPVFLETGIIAPATLVRISAGQSLMWVAQDKDGAGYVVRNNGYTPQKVSTTAVDHSIQNLKTIADAGAFSYQQEGHAFYVVTFPTDQTTWVYDLTTNEWHRRGYWDPSKGAFLAYRPQCYAFAFGGIGFGQNLVGDRSTGNILRMQQALCLDVDQSLIRRVRVCPHIGDRDQEVTFDRLQLDMDLGLGLGVPLSATAAASSLFDAETFISAPPQPGTHQTTPAMTVDIPTVNSRHAAGTPLAFAGWALDSGALLSQLTGVDWVDCYICRPSDVFPGQKVGRTQYGFARPDVAAIYGNQFLNCGFNLAIATPGLPGNYLIVAQMHSVVSGATSTWQVAITVTPYIDGTDPTLMLVYSNDGGVTYGNEMWRSAGKQGDMRIQAFWTRLGTSKLRVFKLVVADPIPWRIVGAWLEIEGS